jgi:hypothetical protein
MLCLIISHGKKYPVTIASLWEQLSMLETLIQIVIRWNLTQMIGIIQHAVIHMKSGWPLSILHGKGIAHAGISLTLTGAVLATSVRLIGIHSRNHLNG